MQLHNDAGALRCCWAAHYHASVQRSMPNVSFWAHLRYLAASCIIKKGISGLAQDGLRAGGIIGLPFSDDLVSAAGSSLFNGEC
jgi:hypothetical protein